MVSSNGWTAGVVHHGPPRRQRHDQPQHRLTVTRTTTHAMPDHYVTAREAFDERVRRLREMGEKFETDGLTIRYLDGDADVTLTYEPMEEQ